MCPELPHSLPGKRQIRGLRRQTQGLWGEIKAREWRRTAHKLFFLLGRGVDRAVFSSIAPKDRRCCCSSTTVLEQQPTALPSGLD